MTRLSHDQDTSGMRRGACPALSAPMQTGDGLLARVALTDAITAAELAGLCRLAHEHGNGMMDISARGNLQIRGLTASSASLLDADVRALGLPLREGLAVETPPFAGLDETEIADPRPLAEAIRAGARTIVGLAPKMTVIVDGGGQLRHAGLLADIRLLAHATPNGVRWTVLLGGIEATAGILDVVDDTTAVKMTLETLRQLAAAGKFARGRDLAAVLPKHEAAAPTPSPFATYRLSDKLWAVGIGPAYGQAEAGRLLELGTTAARLGIKTLRPALDHSLIFFGSGQACEALSSVAEEDGFITRPNDPRSFIAACPGSPSCTAGSIDTHALSHIAIEELGDVLDGSFKLHVTGCPKGCAHPRATELVLCGTADGVAFVAGKASDHAFASTAERDARTSLNRIAALVRAERRKNETTTACIARLGQSRLALCLTSGNP